MVPATSKPSLHSLVPGLERITVHSACKCFHQGVLKQIKPELEQSLALCHQCRQGSSHTAIEHSPLYRVIPLTNLWASVPALHARHWPWWMSFVMTYMNFFVSGNTNWVLVSYGRWRASHQNDPRSGHVCLQGHPGCSKCRSRLSSKAQQVLVSGGLPWDDLSWITVCVQGHCCISLASGHKAAARGSKAEHQRHIYHSTAEEKDPSGQRLFFLPSEIDLN